MPSSDRHSSCSLLRLPAVIASVALLTMAACSEKKTEMVHRDTNKETSPTMLTTNVSTLISDSGITRYRITAPIWLVFDEAREPNWKFPKGLHLEKYDDFFRKEASVDCDSALYLKAQDLWRLDGNVRISNTLGEKFLSEQLFWSNREHKVYTDSFIHIEKQDRIIEGYGFISNDRMTDYSINRPSGIFPVSDFTGRDSTKQAQGSPSATSSSQGTPPSGSMAAPISRPPYGNKTTATK